jgi:hypothetical protein
MRAEDTRSANGSQARELYFWLLKQCLTDLIHEGVDHDGIFDRQKRENGVDWPAHGYTMIGLKRLDNLQACIEELLVDAIPGDLIETGVWRGGAAIFMRAVLRVYGVGDRTVWVADSFQGLPQPDLERHPGDSWWREIPILAVSEAEVRRNFERFGLLDDSVRFLPGWFEDTLPTAPISQLALLRMDGDMYPSTMDALDALYPKLSAGGFVIVDDYFLDGARQAVGDYLARIGASVDIVAIDDQSVFWRKNA